LHPFLRKNNAFVLISTISVLLLLLFSTHGFSQTVFINELHYDNTSTDSLEGVEIFGPAGTDLSCYDIVLYNGGTALSYNTVTLTGIVPDEGCGFGAIWFPIAGIQNGPPDGLALVETCSCVGPCDNDDVVQLLSYEGVFTAADDVAVTLVSTDIGVSEPGAGETSLQLTGSGTVYTDFTWTGPIAFTYDSINVGQVVCPVVATQLTITAVDTGCTMTDSLFSLTVCATDSTESVDITYTGTITLTPVTGPGNLTGTLSMAATAGCATFTGLAIDAAGQYKLVASDGSLINDTTNNIAIADSCGKCIEIQTILVEACEPGPGLEGENEMVKFKVGPTDLDTADIFVDWPNNAWLGTCQNATTSDIIDSINSTITGGGLVIEPVNGVIPAGADVILITSTNFDWATHDWSALNYNLYLIFQCAGNTAGHFKNGQGCPCGTRDLVIQFTGFCSDTVTYSPDSLSGLDGDGADFDPPGNASYGNNGCKPPIFPFSIFISTTVTAASCSDTCDGTAKAIATGGAPPFTYAWNDPSSQTDSVATGLCAGTYSVTVTDAASTVIIAAATVTEPDTLEISFVSQTNVGCNGDSTGIVISTSSGGTGPITYTWNDPLAQTDSLADSLPLGTFTLIIIDVNGCSDTDSVTITEPTALSISSSSSTNTNCFGDSTGTATTATAGGSGPYTYLWDDFQSQTNAIATGLSAGSYTMVVSDSNACQDSVTITVGQPIVLSAAISDSSAANCNGDSTGYATVTPAGGTGGYAYLWDDVNAQTDSVANGLPLGSYTVLITDGNGCQTTVGTSVAEPSPFSLATSSTDASCGLTDGTANISASGATPPYSYSWSIIPPQTDSTATGLGFGTYTVTVVDSLGCIDSITAGVSNAGGPTVTMTDSVNVSCNGDSTGSAIVTPSGGTAPYTYLWDDPNAQTDSTATGLLAGGYIVSVADAGGCGTVASVTITEPAALSLSFTSTLAACGDSSGTATVSVTGGTSPYNYLWNAPGSQSDTIATGLSAGTYTVTVTDDSGCVAMDSIVVTESTAFTLTSGAINVQCNGDASGTAIVSAAGGSSPFVYAWNDPNTQTTANAIGLSAGTFTVVVVDSDGCVDSSTVIVNEPTPLSGTFAVTNVSCNGACNGSITGSPSGGTGTPSSWSLLWSTGDTTLTISGLCAGGYTVLMVDSVGCTASDSVMVTEPPALLVNASGTDVICNGSADGTLSAVVTGGNTPFTYSWTGGLPTVPSHTAVSAGSYGVTVTDSTGCVANDSVTITEPSAIILTVTSTPSICGNGGSVSATVGGGVFPYVFLWDDPNSSTSITVFISVAGIYTVTVTDNNGCSQSVSASVTATVGPVLDSIIVSGESCIGEADGTINIYASSGIQPYTYAWDDPSLSTTVTSQNVAAGVYYLIVLDAQFCGTADSVFVSAGTVACDVPDSLNIPSSFTPNADLINDTWIIRGISNFPDNSVEIYNRWGALLYSSDGYAEPWDGTYEGSDVASATYYYIIILDDNQDPFTGSVTIVR